MQHILAALQQIPGHDVGMSQTAHAVAEKFDTESDEAIAFRELAADLALSAPVYALEGGRLACALCDAVGDASAVKHEPSCLISRAQRLIKRDALEALDDLGC
jgi:hypothetical protein